MEARRALRERRRGRALLYLGAEASALLVLVAVYLVVLYPWQINWGATPAEQRMALSGDPLVPEPATQFTRAITIQAPAKSVWPWIVQMGQDRAGFYSYDWLENQSGIGVVFLLAPATS